MSAPSTVVITSEIAALLLAAQILHERNSGTSSVRAPLVEEALAREGRALPSEAADFETLLAEAQAQEQERRAWRQDMQAAEETRLSGLRAMVETLEQRIARLSGLLGVSVAAFSRPPTPRGADAALWSAYARQLETLAQELEERCAERAGQAVQQALAAVEALPDLDNILALYLAQRQAERGEAEQTRWRELVERVLARLELPAGKAVPTRLEMLARDVILADSPARAELLANELRLGVQQERQEQEAMRQEASQARAWLARLPENDLPEPLRALLSEVAAGLHRLDVETRRRVEALVAVFEEDEARRAQAAAAVVLEQSLKDLGYQVEPIQETLFASGGMTHLQRSGWEDYYVRLRLNAKEKTLNFNVVREKNENATADVNERRRRDFMAEDRWCAEFPKLLATLAARGLDMKIIRRLDAGELPVQEVAPDVLPRFDAEEGFWRKTASKSMPLPDKKS
ncbi:MAG: hypothetical protein LBS89_02540 [Zoogloeaceae bacterium]|jgi:hypothetical protein|nr:hypothetical protein [Zoogloeaceae bacterium]